MLGSFFKGNEIQDLREYQIFNNTDVKQLRRKVEILFIDDEDLPVINSLRNHCFNVTHKRDIDNINDVLAYGIILCDIRGVGKEFDSPKEGAYVIKEIKANYPDKKVIAYTGSTYDATYNEYLKLADSVLTKDITTDIWVNALDNEIKNLLDPIHQWGVIRDKLLEQDISINTVRRLEAEYVKAIKTRSFESLEKLVEKLDNNEKIWKTINSLLSSLLVKIILGGLE